MGTELIEQPAPNPLAIIQAAVERGMDPDQLEKLLALQERHERNEAVKAFALAIQGFQKECPIIKKERKSGKDNDKFGYVFANYDDIMREIRPLLSKWEITVTFSEPPDDNDSKRLKLMCRIRHGIHHEDHWFAMPIPDMKTNDTQKRGAALSYAKRYLLCAALNIVVSEEDDDAANLSTLISEAQCLELSDIIQEKRVDPALFLEWVSQIVKRPVERLDDIPTAFFAKVKDGLRRAKGGAK